MGKELSTYIYNKMLEEPRNYQWRIVDDSHKQAIELYLAINIKIDSNKFVQDVTGQINNKDELYFEEVVCFYNQEKNKIVKNNYLKAIPVDSVRGIEQGYIDAFLRQLNIRISTARTELKNFFKNRQQKEFVITWNEENMENTAQTMRETNNYSRERLQFSNEEKSLVDKFKGDQHDGLERV